MAEVCGDLPLRTCRPRLRRCLNLQQEGEDARATREAVKDCAANSGVTLQDLIQAVRRAGASKDPAAVLDNLDVAKEKAEEMRLCILRSRGLLDENDNLDGAKVRFELESRINTTLASSPDLLNTMTAALAECPLPVDVTGIQGFSQCLTTQCVLNFPTN